MNAVIAATNLGKRYGRRSGLTDCNLQIPPGRIVGLVGPNGAGKTTLLRLAAGLLAPSSGWIEVLGARPAVNASQLARVGFVAQDHPLYTSLSVDDHLQLGARLNPGWDDNLARTRITSLGLVPRQRAGRLSGGQRAQLALTLAIAKRPELLLLDEPAANLDPLARRDFMSGLMVFAAEHGTSVVLSSHMMEDVQRACDYVVVLIDSKVRIAGEVDDLLANHSRLSGPRRNANRLPANQLLIEARHTERQSTFLVRTEGPVYDPAWTVSSVSLEDIVLAYMENSPEEPSHRGIVVGVPT